MQEIEYLTVAQVAAILRVSTDTVIRKFGNQPGVIDLGTPEMQHKRRYRVQTRHSGLPTPRERHPFERCRVYVRR
jgi:hypothetical protein